MAPLKVLLVNAINPRVEVESRYPSLGLGYLAAAARKALGPSQVEFSIIDSEVEAAGSRFRPDLVGVSSVSQNFEVAKRYVERFAAGGVPVVIGGVHVSTLPNCLPPGATVACLGDSEDTFVDVLRAQLGGGLTSSTLAGIPGVAYREGGELKKTEARKPRVDLDTLPMPARDLIPMRPHTYMFTSRGCPFKCAFCASTRYWDKLRFFSPEYVVEEIELLRRQYGVTMISFFDDLFVANPHRLEEIIRLLEKRHLLGKIAYTCSCRANVMKPDLVRMLSRMGVVSVGMGLESGDDETLRYLKGGVSVAQNYQAVRLLKAAGIAANASFVIGSPKETRAQVMKTYDFIRKSGLDLFDVYLLTPYPGTPVWDSARERGLVSEAMTDWSVLDVNAYRDPDKAIIVSEVLSRREVLALYRKFRRLRLYRNGIKVLNHPMKRDLPRMMWKLVQERVSHYLQSRTSPS